MSAGPQRPTEFTTLDWIGTVVASFGVLGLFYFPVAARSFAIMFRDLGSGDRLPLLTRLAISSWFPAIIGVVALGGIIMGIRPTASIQHRRACIVGAFILGSAGIALCVIGAYLPIFALAGAIKPD